MNVDSKNHKVLATQLATNVSLESLYKAFMEQFTSSKDPTHFVAIILVIRLFEAINFIFIFRWLTHLKIDIMRFIRLLKTKRLAAQSATPNPIE